jgi:hypothetical protein
VRRTGAAQGLFAAPPPDLAKPPHYSVHGKSGIRGDLRDRNRMLQACYPAQIEILRE